MYQVFTVLRIISGRDKLAMLIKVQNWSHKDESNEKKAPGELDFIMDCS